MFKKLLRVWFIVKNLSSLSYTGQGKDHLLVDCSDKDLRDLSLGRWQMYKHTNVPEFTIGLNKDMESILFRVIYIRMGGKPLGGSDYLDQVSQCIEVCEEVYGRGKRIDSWFKEQGIL